MDLGLINNINITLNDLIKTLNITWDEKECTIEDMVRGVLSFLAEGGYNDTEDAVIDYINHNIKMGLMFKGGN